MVEIMLVHEFLLFFFLPFNLRLILIWKRHQDKADVLQNLKSNSTAQSC